MLGGKPIDPAVDAGCAAEWTVVETVSVTGDVAVPVTVMDPDGENTQFVAAGKAVQARLTLPA
jgi:hypothetical protein